MTVRIIAFPAETSQQEADRVLAVWQEQRRAGIKPEQRHIPDDTFERDLAISRECMERTR
jgi:hypothetical protein